MQKYAVIGYPLTHTLSPQIHNFAFKQLHINAEYKKIEIHPENLETSIQHLKNSGYRGLNITIPHKLSIMSFLDEIDIDADTIGAVNTVLKKEDKWIGYNTDVSGFLVPLSKFKNRIQNCLILGTGGAARAVSYALARYVKPRLITIVGRNPEKTKNLIHIFTSLFQTVNFRQQSFHGIKTYLHDFNLIVNTTPVGMYPKVEHSPLPFIDNLAEKTIVYDLVYNPTYTKFLRDANKMGKNIKLINGREMLIQQAASSFKLWTNQDMPTDKVRDYLSNQ